jgi:hypothetical protein
LHKLRESYQTNEKFARRHGAVTSEERLRTSKALISTTKSDNYRYDHNQQIRQAIIEEFLTKPQPNKTLKKHVSLSARTLKIHNDTQNLFSNITVTFDEKVSNRNAEVRSEVESVASDPHHGVQEDRTTEFSFLGTADTQPPCISFDAIVQWRRESCLGFTPLVPLRKVTTPALDAFRFHLIVRCRVFVEENYRVDADRRCFLIVGRRDQ